MTDTILSKEEWAIVTTGSGEDIELLVPNWDDDRDVPAGGQFLIAAYLRAKSDPDWTKELNDWFDSQMKQAIEAAPEEEG